MARTYCNYCKYIRRDAMESTSHINAVECGNPGSEFFGALLNISLGGKIEPSIQHTGCTNGKCREDGKEVIIRNRKRINPEKEILLVDVMAALGVVVEPQKERELVSA